MIGLDTNVLAGYDIEDKTDSPAQRQRVVARWLIESGQPLMVCKTMILELEWRMCFITPAIEAAPAWRRLTTAGSRGAPRNWA
jgi:hypothetical protein